MLIINATNETPLKNGNKLSDLLIHRYNRFRSIKNIDYNSLEKPSTSSSSSFLSNLRRRSVILPRICYFARISGTNGHQKLCLPYDDIRS